MLLAADDRKQAARLFGFLALGEQLSRDCARGQAKLAPDKAMRRFLLMQARQETFHKRLFEGAILYLAPRGIHRPPSLAPLTKYRQLIEQALHEGNLAETLLAQQVLLEGLGEVLLDRIDQGMTDRGMGLERLRRLVLAQEHTHHAFGLRRIERFIDTQNHARDKLQRRTQEYLYLIEKIFTELMEFFEFFDEDPRAYVSELRNGLPESLRT
jgi:hypothetical protein